MSSSWFWPPYKHRLLVLDRFLSGTSASAWLLSCSKCIPLPGGHRSPWVRPVWLLFLTSSQASISRTMMSARCLQAWTLISNLTWEMSHCHPSLRLTTVSQARSSSSWCGTWRKWPYGSFRCALDDNPCWHSTGGWRNGNSAGSGGPPSSDSAFSLERFSSTIVDS